MKRFVLAALLLLAAAVPSFAQTTVVKNPKRVAFTCPDHALDTQHELDIIDLKGVVIQTILLGDPPINPATGDVEATINVQPIAFGSYTMKARAVAGTSKSDDSIATDVWERVPGAPGKPKTGQ